jgi:hypothetical protein
MPRRSCERRKSRARRTEEERAEAFFLWERRRRRRTQCARCASSSKLDCPGELRPDLLDR